MLSSWSVKLAIRFHLMQDCGSIWLYVHSLVWHIRTGKPLPVTYETQATEYIGVA